MILEGIISIALTRVVDIVMNKALKKTKTKTKNRPRKIKNNGKNLLQLEEHIVSKNVSTATFIPHNHVEHKIIPLLNCC